MRLPCNDVTSRLVNKFMGWMNEWCVHSATFIHLIVQLGGLKQDYLATTLHRGL